MRDQPPFPPPPDDIQEIGTPEQFAALAHPLRQRLLFALGHGPATISGLAVQLDTKKGNVAHHLKVLREAGLVHITETRQVRGGTEQHYRRTARRIDVAEPQEASTAAMFAAVAQELNHSPRPDAPDTAPPAAQPREGTTTRRDSPDWSTKPRRTPEINPCTVCW
ncbi:ArsR/SmtB family transcription factor [Streptomyces atratus]|uniref:ArsR/SmtB family transcription factor n=1 Tax=Streptomyces atratus TaxID=1893 RepID=UPI0036D02821